MSHFRTTCKGCGTVVAQCRCRSPNKEERTVESCKWCPKEKTAHKLQGYTEHQGIPIAIENRKGSVRSGVDKDGKPWRTVMKWPYGYIKGTKGADGEEVDCYVGPVKKAPEAFVVHQHKSNGKGFDEDKVMFGFESHDAARKAYLEHYNSPKFLGPISTVAVEKLKDLIASGKKLVKISEVTSSAFFDELSRISEGTDASS